MADRSKMTIEQRRGRSGRPWQRVRKLVLERDAYRCQIGIKGCTVTATVVDHIVPLAAGGEPLDPSNLRAACRSCNGSRHAEGAASIKVVRSRFW
jgi:5-methylcytosine-specific restriction endonuclease McrA